MKKKIITCLLTGSLTVSLFTGCELSEADLEAMLAELEEEEKTENPDTNTEAETEVSSDTEEPDAASSDARDFLQFFDTGQPEGTWAVSGYTSGSVQYAVTLTDTEGNELHLGASPETGKALAETDKSPYALYVTDLSYSDSFPEEPERTLREEHEELCSVLLMYASINLGTDASVLEDIETQAAANAGLSTEEMETMEDLDDATADAVYMDVINSLYALMTKEDIIRIQEAMDEYQEKKAEAVADGYLDGYMVTDSSGNILGQLSADEVTEYIAVQEELLDSIRDGAAELSGEIKLSELVPGQTYLLPAESSEDGYLVSIRNDTSDAVDLYVCQTEESVGTSFSIKDLPAPEQEDDGQNTYIEASSDPFTILFQYSIPEPPVSSQAE
jgi:hypothetical protein